MQQFCNATKMKNANVSWLLKVLLALKFFNVSIWQLTGLAAHRHYRHTFYRFLSNPGYNRRRLLASVSEVLIRELDRLTSSKGDRVLIIVDCLYKRPHSKAVEYLGR
jgi:hypothetical protein